MLSSNSNGRIFLQLFVFFVGGSESKFVWLRRQVAREYTEIRFKELRKAQEPAKIVGIDILTRDHHDMKLACTSISLSYKGNCSLNSESSHTEPILKSAEVSYK
jgi:hypothetical protein